MKTNINDAKPPGSFLGQGQGGPRLRVAKEAWLGEALGSGSENSETVEKS